MSRHSTFASSRLPQIWSMCSSLRVTSPIAGASFEIDGVLSTFDEPGTRSNPTTRFQASWLANSRPANALSGCGRRTAWALDQASSTAGLSALHDEETWSCGAPTSITTITHGSSYGFRQA